MGISLSSIRNQLKAWEKSPAGRAAIGNVIDQYRKEGRSRTEGGSEIITEEVMIRLANEFIGLLALKAGAYAGTGGDGSIPTSVTASISNMVAGAPVLLEDGSFMIDISFVDDLSRPSLRKKDGNRTGDGIDNIIALFNNGANASKAVFGIWDGHTTTPIKSKPVRPGLGFMQEAKEEFENKYKARYGITVALSSEYGD